MLFAYIVCFLAGGIVLAASLLGGHDGHADGGAEVDDSVEAAHAHHDLRAHHGWLEKLPFLSLRFWIWSATFFGLTGLVLTFTDTSAALTLALATAAGVGTGWGASYAFSKLTKAVVGEVPEASSLIGSEGRLLLPLVRSEPGKVRLRVGGADVDLVAESDGQDALPAGTAVWVVGLRGTHVVVEASPVPLEGEDGTSDEAKEKP